ncbi:MAG: hypothetical protein AMXMBFR81_07420 [Chthonomonas sp.]
MERAAIAMDRKTAMSESPGYADLMLEARYALSKLPVLISPRARCAAIVTDASEGASTGDSVWEAVRGRRARHATRRRKMDKQIAK